MHVMLLLLDFQRFLARYHPRLIMLINCNLDLQVTVIGTGVLNRRWCVRVMFTEAPHSDSSSIVFIRTIPLCLLKVIPIICAGG